MATAIISKPSKWFTKNFKLISTLARRNHSRSKSSHPPIKPKNSTKEEELLMVFNHFDSNGDGKISSEELGLYFTSVGENMSHDNVQRVIKDFDANGDNSLEFSDFVRLVEGDNNVDEDIRGAFEMFEVDKGSGCITPRGLQQMFNRLGDAKSYEECVAMIRVFDLDGNGVIDFNEFHKMMA